MVQCNRGQNKFKTSMNFSSFSYKGLDAIINEADMRVVDFKSGVRM